MPRALGTRILTALALLVPVLLALYLLPPLWFALLAGLIVLLAGWEWGTLVVGGNTAARVAFLIAIAALGALAALRPDASRALLAAASACWAWAALEVLLFPRLAGRAGATPPRLRWTLLGVLVLAGAWLGIVELREVHPHLLLVVCLVVWGADVLAYFAGHAFGRHKLAPQVSPGKTWEGAIGGVLGGAAVAWGFAVWAFGNDLPAVIVPLLLALAALSIFGDLFESVLKRTAGAKDSGALLPGHGGLLDRVDALICVLPVAALTLVGLSLRAA
ncbi:MAG: phosphatidate cytidylyltransferase [Pseudomonadota bacterium]